MTRRRAFRSRRIVTPEGLLDGAVIVEDGRITAVTDDVADLPPETERLGSLAILPGGVDPHVHLNDPGRADWEGMASGTRAAAAGGLTTLADMPLNSDPVTVTAAALAAKRAVARELEQRGELRAEMVFYGGLVPGNLHHLEPMLDAGVAGIKAFLVDSGIDDFPAVGEHELRPAMEILARREVPLLVHAELQSAAGPPAGAPAAGGPNRYATWLASRPSRFETAAHDLLLRLVRATGCHVHIVHLATADALPALAEARAAGLPVSVETCPHYLTFAAEEIPDADPRFKCAPPIRAARHRRALWRALAEGTLDLVASDHSPAPSSMKSGDLMTAWGGIASLQVSLAATWSGARERGFGLGDLARWMSAAPARLLRLEGRKGAVAAGHDADLTIFDPEAEWRVEGADLEHRHPQTAYEGRRLTGRVVRSYSQGRRVWDDESRESDKRPDLR